MRKFFYISCCFCFLLALSLLTTNSSLAEIPNSLKISFVDLDGDGFNDLDADDNSNGIPDKFEKKKVTAPVQTASLLGDMFNQPELIPDVVNLSATRKDKFGIMSFKTRSIGSHRIGFNCASGFGSGSGINVGSAVSGCEGGACARQ